MPRRDRDLPSSARLTALTTPRRPPARRAARTFPEAARSPAAPSSGGDGQGWAPEPQPGAHQPTVARPAPTQTAPRPTVAPQASTQTAATAPAASRRAAAPSVHAPQADPDPAPPRAAEALRVPMPTEQLRPPLAPPTAAAPVRSETRPDLPRPVAAPGVTATTARTPDRATAPATTGPVRTATAWESAAAEYASIHGDPLEPSAHARRRLRWTVSWRLAGAAAGILLLVGGGVALRASSLSPGPAIDLPEPAPSGTAVPATPSTGQVVVDVVGAVAAPGVVRLAAGSRVVDALAAVGGGTAEAQLGALNLARVLVDGEQIVVPAVGDQPVGAQPGSTGPAAGGDDRVDLNAADAADLDALPGIGPVLAGRIVAHREDGPFTSVDELADVAGIGPTLLERLRDLVRV